MTETTAIPNEIVGRNWQMDPETDDLIRGDMLTEGMVVLVEELSMRIDTDSADYPEKANAYEIARVQTHQRWCRVTELRVKDGMVSFIGVYSDGTKASRTYNVSWFWYTTS